MKTSKKLRIAIIGARGIGNYGGFESVVSELGPALVERGYTVYCSCEKTEVDEASKYFGVERIYFPFKPPSNYTLRKAFEILYDMYFTIKCSFSCDIIYALGIGTSISLVIPRLFRKISIVNVDGLEWRRSKFSPMEKILLKIMFSTCCVLSNTIIVDNNSLINYINRNYYKKINFIPYGVNIPRFIQWDNNKLVSFTIINNFKISPNKFWLVVARLEPENNIHIIIDGFLKSKTSMPLVIIGDFTSDSYKQEILDMISHSNSNKILLLGSIYNLDILNMFRQNCFAYIHGHSAGGTNPSLLEAMAMKNIIVAHDNEFNREVGGKTIVYFKESIDLKNCIESIEHNCSAYLALKSNAYERILAHYSWKDVTIKYNTLFKDYNN